MAFLTVDLTVDLMAKRAFLAEREVLDATEPMDGDERNDAGPRGAMAHCCCSQRKVRFL
jgi:hypothetical protein